MNFVSNLIWNSVEGFVEAGTRTAGGYAGDALIKAGDMIEGSGRSVGMISGIERTAGNYSTKINGQSYKTSAKALPSTARKPAMKRSNSSPAASGGYAAKKVGSGVPLGAKKNPPGAKQITGGAQKAIGGVGGGVGKTAGGAGKAIGGVGGGVGKTAGGAIGGVGGGVNKTTGGAQKAIGGIGGGVGKSVGGGINNLNKTAGGITNGASKQLPKPYSPFGAQNAGSSYNNPYPTEKKSAVQPGRPKPFTPQPPKNMNAAGEKKPYPGTNTIPGQGSRTPVKKYKPLERMQGTAEHGKATFV